MSPDVFPSLDEGIPEQALARTALGGAWLESSAISFQLRRSPSRRPFGSLLLPAAALLLSSAWIASYFGVPAAPLNVAVLALLLGHLWPTWLAADSVRHWAPRERYLRYRLSPEGIETWSLGSARQLDWSRLTCVHRSALGWLVRFRGAPPLWVPEAAFCEADAQVAASYLDVFPAERRGYLVAAGFFTLAVIAWCASLAWYMSAR